MINITCCSVNIWRWKALTNITNMLLCLIISKSKLALPSFHYFNLVRCIIDKDHLFPDDTNPYIIFDLEVNKRYSLSCFVKKYYHINMFNCIGIICFLPFRWLLGVELGYKEVDVNSGDIVSKPFYTSILQSQKWPILSKLSHFYADKEGRYTTENTSDVIFFRFEIFSPKS